MTEREALRSALEKYMSAFGQALEAYGIEFQQQQIEADRIAREALAQSSGSVEQEPTNLERHERNVQQLFGKPQPEKEPVANYCKECLTYNGHQEGCSHYATPQQRTWVGLTDDERDHLAGVHLYASSDQITTWIEGVDNFAQAIEKLLKEKNT